MDYKLTFLSSIILLTISCATAQKENIEGIVQMKLVFYNPDGVPLFTDIKKVWYNDSITIEKVDRTNFLEESSKSTVTYSTVLFRLIDLRAKVLYDYKNFSDTATPFNKAILPDSMMKDCCWSYYSDKVRQISGTPQNLNDTTINNVNYKKIKFNFIGDNIEKGYKIGYLRNGRTGELFSIEKKFSKESNCVMVKFEDFEIGKSLPNAVMEVEYISDSLNETERKIFAKWRQNVKDYPVNRIFDNDNKPIQ